MCQSRSIDTLATLTSKNALTQNNVVTCMVSALTGHAMNFMHEMNTSKEEYVFAKVVESIMSLTSRQSIMPLHFREQLLVYMQSHSRLVIELLAQTTPSGH